MNLNNLQTFVAAARAGSFTRAAALLGVPKSTVGRRVSQLEEELRIVLIERSGRTFKLTHDGEALFRRVAPSLEDIEQVRRNLTDSPDALRGILRLTTTSDFAGTPFFSSLLNDYVEQHPEVRIEVHCSQRVRDLIEEGLDLAFRNHSGPLPDRSDLVAKPLGRLNLGLYASMSYLARAPRIFRWEDLAGHPIIGLSALPQSAWPRPPSIEVDEFVPLADILGAGGGVGALPDFVAAPRVARGELVRVPVENRQRYAQVQLSMVWVRSRHLSPRLRRFIDLCSERSRSETWLQGETASG